jgi:hypothetical protein
MILRAEHDQIGVNLGSHPQNGAGAPCQTRRARTPADLTQITKHARGAFPAAQLTRIIDGRQLVRAHSDPRCRDGAVFSRSLTHAVEAAVRQKVEAIVQYLQSIQERQARVEP